MMITLQHTALAIMATCGRYHFNDVIPYISRTVPWLVLPDAIRAYIGPRQPSHFETLPDMTDCSWMKFPEEITLREMTKDAASGMVEYHLAEGIRPCVIGEESQIEIFDEKNYGHRHFHELRTHIVQDIILDFTLRDNMVDVKDRFNDRFVVKHNTQCVLTGKELREQVKIFEELGFLHMAGKVYGQSGMLLNSEWFAKFIYPALKRVYPADLADTTFKFMAIPSYIEERINDMAFSITDEDQSRVVITSDLEREFDKLFSLALINTCRELF